MKITTAILFSLLSLSTFAKDHIVCHSEKGGLKSDAVLEFDLKEVRGYKFIEKIVGHIFVNSQFESNEPISVDNSYMAFFKTDSLKENTNYRPTKYYGYAQFKGLDDSHSVGLESGMWGDLSMNLQDAQKTFHAVYVFQAGDHMGGSLHFKCSRR